MFDIVTVGSATMDVFLRSSAFQIGKRDQEELILSGGKQEVEEKHLAVGGGGTNTAVGFSRLGWRTACVARFGQDWAGNWVHGELEKEKIDLSYLQQVAEEETDYSTILLSPEGERIILVHRGPTRLVKKMFPQKLFETTKWLYISSLEGNLSLLNYLVEQAQRNDVAVALNPGRRELTQKQALLKVLGKVAVFQLNEEEACLLAGQNYWSILQDCGVSKTVVVTKGKNGAEFLTKKGPKSLPINKTKTVDATGAGDAFGVGLVHGLMQQKPVDEAVEIGMIESASVVGQIGAKAGLLTRQSLKQKLMKENNAL